MKKYLYLFGAFGTAIFSSSCKKDYTCECTSTDSNSNNANITEITIKEASKHAAKANCLSTERDGTTYNYVAGYYTYSYGYVTGYVQPTYIEVPVTYTTECELD
jgi:hypothetical protein